MQEYQKVREKRERERERERNVSLYFVVGEITIKNIIHDSVQFLRRVNFFFPFPFFCFVIFFLQKTGAVLIEAQGIEESVLLQTAKQLKNAGVAGGGGGGEGGEEGKISSSNIIAAGSPVRAARAGSAASPTKNSTAKKGSRYQLLHERVQHQQYALVEAQEALAKFKLEHDLMTTQLQTSKNITGELLVCVEYYRTKTHKYHKMLYPPPPKDGHKRTAGEERLDQLRRELARVTNMPKRTRTLTSSLLHQGVPQTFQRDDFEIALMREIDAVSKDVGAIAMQRIVRGAFTRERLYEEKLLRSAIFVQSRYRGYETRKRLVWET